MKYKVGDEVVICGPSVSGLTRDGVAVVYKLLEESYRLKRKNGEGAGTYNAESLKSAKTHYIQQFKKAYDSL